MPNRLASETSPYLLQHAHNPVDWYPWCDEALALAREQDRPILLSIGYSACHWCHVMEHESFEDAETAALMNRSFVNIKVDREERPDVDSIYMRAVQAMTGHGGWPLTAFLTPAGVPYYGGTYFPPEPRHGMPSFRQVLAAAANAYHSRRDEVARAGAQLTEVLNRSATEPQPASGPFDLSDGRLFAHAVSAAGRTFDPTHGGFGGAPKFPQPDFLDFLLRTGGPESHGVSMASHTLSRMAAGGIRDHAGGGFHRYSVDARWLVPHFEKMLYDNALIARALIRAHLLGARHLGAVAEETLDYVLEDLTSPEGVFYSARDADSEGEEGLFYLWTPAEVAAVLGRDEARLVSRVYDVSEAGNFEGRNILHLPHDLDAVARQEGIGRDELDGRLRDSLAALKDHRAARPEPLRDDKVLTSWNGFTIRALAEAGPALGRPDYTAAGARAASFLLETVRRGDRLLRVFAAGRAHIDGFLEDYGALGNACLSLYEATLDAHAGSPRPPASPTPPSPTSGPPPRSSSMTPPPTGRRWWCVPATSWTTPRRPGTRSRWSCSSAWRRSPGRPRTARSPRPFSRGNAARWSAIPRRWAGFSPRRFSTRPPAWKSRWWDPRRRFRVCWTWLTDTPTRTGSSPAAIRKTPRSPRCPPWRAGWTAPDRPSSASGRPARSRCPPHRLWTRRSRGPNLSVLRADRPGNSTSGSTWRHAKTTSARTSKPTFPTGRNSWRGTGQWSRRAPSTIVKSSFSVRARSSS